MTLNLKYDAIPLLLYGNGIYLFIWFDCVLTSNNNLRNLETMLFHSYYSRTNSLAIVLLLRTFDVFRLFVNVQLV